MVCSRGLLVFLGESTVRQSNYGFFWPLGPISAQWVQINLTCIWPQYSVHFNRQFVFFNPFFEGPIGLLCNLPFYSMISKTPWQICSFIQAVHIRQACSTGQNSGGAGSNAARRRCLAAPSDPPKSGGGAATPLPLPFWHAWLGDAELSEISEGNK